MALIINIGKDRVVTAKEIIQNYCAKHNNGCEECYFNTVEQGRNDCILQKNMCPEDWPNDWNQGFER